MNTIDDQLRYKICHVKSARQRSWCRGDALSLVDVAQRILNRSWTSMIFIINDNKLYIGKWYKPNVHNIMTTLVTLCYTRSHE